MRFQKMLCTSIQRILSLQVRASAAGTLPPKWGPHDGFGRTARARAGEQSNKPEGAALW